jgi:hypothetical protein
VGNVVPISCISTNLYVTNGALPANGCLVEDVVQGTDPLQGTFELSLNTIGHNVINVQDIERTTSIAHNAPGNITESGGDGTSLQEKLMTLRNVGDINVARSDVNRKNGGYMLSSQEDNGVIRVSRKIPLMIFVTPPVTCLP